MQRDYSMMTKAASSLAMLLALAAPAYAQYPGHIENGKEKGPTVRAIAVLEWTGDMGKPSASRIIPISVFDGEQYQPGGLYLAKPEPLALEPGTEYVLQDAGWHAVCSTSTRRRMWTAIGLATARGSPWLPPPKKGEAKARQKHAPGGDRCGERPASFQGNGIRAATPRPQTHPRPASPPASSNPPAGDPDRPTLRRRSESSASAPAASSAAVRTARRPRPHRRRRPGPATHGSWPADA